MARQRRITELIKDEVEKPIDSQPVNGVIDVTADPVDVTVKEQVKPAEDKVRTPARRNGKTTELEKNQAQSPAKTVVSQETVIKEVVSQQIIDPNPELAAKIDKLQAELDAAAKNAIALQGELATVKQQLSQQMTLSNQLETELEQAKKGAVHLAESNEELNQQLDTLKEEKSAIVTQAEAQRSKSKSKMETFKQQPQPQRQDKPVYQPVPVRKTDRIYRDRFFARVPPTPTRTTEDNTDEDTSSQMWLLD